jgi:regulator of RNase E activity RraA
MGDDDGVVVIPSAQEDGLASLLEVLRLKEEELIQGIKDGVYLAEKLGFSAMFEVGNPDS